jgi:predicted DNA-binding transcriptional regulator AlpA
MGDRRPTRSELDVNQLGFGAMTKRIPPFNERRVLSTAEVAAYLGKSGAWWSTHAEALHRAGFPRPLPVVGGFDKEAVDRWLDSLHKGKHFADFDAAWTRAAGG